MYPIDIPKNILRENEKRQTVPRTKIWDKYSIMPRNNLLSHFRDNFYPHIHTQTLMTMNTSEILKSRYYCCGMGVPQNPQNILSEIKDNDNNATIRK